LDCVFLPELLFRHGKVIHNNELARPQCPRTNWAIKIESKVLALESFASSQPASDREHASVPKSRLIVSTLSGVIEQFREHVATAHSDDTPNSEAMRRR
jgi:hypothetical protein